MPLAPLLALLALQPREGPFSDQPVERLESFLIRSPVHAGRSPD